MHGRAIINKLASIQRQAAIMITGAMKTTATDILEAMANLLPFQLLVDKIRHRAALRLATLPPAHPLHKPVQNAANRLVKRHPTPLHDLMHRYKIHPQLIETIKANRHNLDWTPNVITRIAANADDAITELEHDNPDVKVSALHGPAGPESRGFGLAQAGFGFVKSQARPKSPLTAWLRLGLAQAAAFEDKKYFLFIPQLPVYVNNV